MKRILLLLDDYVELTFLETILKKVGFDTVGYQGVISAGDKTLQVLPDLLILSDIIKSMPTSDALVQIKKMRPQVKCLLLRRDFSVVLEHNLKLLDLTLKSPIEPLDFLKHVCSILQVKAEPILEKFMKLGLFRGTEAEPYIKVQGSLSSPQKVEVPNFVTKTLSSHKDREKKYQQAVNLVREPRSRAIDSKVASREASEFRSRSADKELQRIDLERQEFVKSLFKKN